VVNTVSIRAHSAGGHGLVMAPQASGSRTLPALPRTQGRGEGRGRTGKAHP